MSKQRPSRPYDVVMTSEFREKVRARRLSPDGQLRRVTTQKRGSSIVQKYPWDQLLLGDFFIAPLNGSRFDNAYNKMQQIARVRDWEISVCRWPCGTEPGIRVTLVLTELRELKFKYRNHHNGDIKIHNRQAYLNRRAAEQKASYHRRKGQPLTPRPVDPEVHRYPKEEPTLLTVIDPGAAVALGDSDAAKRKAELMKLRKQALKKGHDDGA